MRDRRWMLDVLRLMFGGRATLRRSRRWFWRGSVKIIRQSGLHPAFRHGKPTASKTTATFYFPHL